MYEHNTSGADRAVMRARGVYKSFAPRGGGPYHDVIMDEYASRMRALLSIAGVSSLAFAPLLVFAEDGVGAATFVNSLSLWIAVSVGAVASALSFAFGRQLSKKGFGLIGEIFGKAIDYFSAGMFIVMSGFFAVVVPPWSSPFVIMRVHDFLSIIGYITMLFGARQLWKLTQIHSESQNQT